MLRREDAPERGNSKHPFDTPGDFRSSSFERFALKAVVEEVPGAFVKGIDYILVFPGPVIEDVFEGDQGRTAGDSETKSYEVAEGYGLFCGEVTPESVEHEHAQGQCRVVLLVFLQGREVLGHAEVEHRNSDKVLHLLHVDVDEAVRKARR